MARVFNLSFEQGRGCGSPDRPHWPCPWPQLAGRVAFGSEVFTALCGNLGFRAQDFVHGALDTGEVHKCAQPNPDYAGAVGVAPTPSVTEWDSEASVQSERVMSVGRSVATRYSRSVSSVRCVSTHSIGEGHFPIQRSPQNGEGVASGRIFEICFGLIPKNFSRRGGALRRPDIGGMVGRSLRGPDEKGSAPAGLRDCKSLRLT